MLNAKILLVGVGALLVLLRKSPRSYRPPGLPPPSTTPPANDSGSDNGGGSTQSETVRQVQAAINDWRNALLDLGLFSAVNVPEPLPARRRLNDQGSTCSGGALVEDGVLGVCTETAEALVGLDAEAWRAAGVRIRTGRIDQIRDCKEAYRIAIDIDDEIAKREYAQDAERFLRNNRPRAFRMV